MVKSNKFDYTNKKNTGVALGQFIAKQLDSEANAVKRAAERQAKKHSSSSGHDVGDADLSVVHHIDMRLPGKELGDDGLAVLADGLETALSKSTAEAALMLQDLDLTGNHLTTAGLARLANCIEAVSSDDLRTLALANNQIRVETNQEAVEWEIFLRAFSHCGKVRRLDLSGNAALGARAMEVLARVHVREPQFAPCNVPGRRCEGKSPDEDAPRSSMELPLTAGGPCCYGLRSIAYINLTDIDITATGALWLSYALEDHYFPSQLGLEPGTGERAVTSEKLPVGLEYSTDRVLGSKDATLLLAETNKARHRLLLADGEGEALNGPSKSSRLPGMRPVSLKAADGGTSEVDRLRHRIQRHLLSGEGRSEVELWRVAFAVLRCCNGVLALTLDLTHNETYASPRKYYTGVYQLPLRSSSTFGPSASSSIESSPMTSPALGPPVSPTPSWESVPAYRSYAKLVKATPADPKPGNGENRHVSPRVVLRPQRRDTASEDKDVAAAAKHMVKLAMSEGFLERSVRWQERRVNAEGGQVAFRDRNIVCHLPRRLLERLLSTAVSDRDVGLLSDEQMDAILMWTLHAHRSRGETVRQAGWRGKDPSVLAWNTLEAVRCLEYVQ